MKNIDKIRLANDALTNRAKNAFRYAEHAEPQRAFLANFANIGENYVVDYKGAFVFSFHIDDLIEVKNKIRAATGKIIDVHEHNGIFDMTCDIVNDKYCTFRITLSNDAYSADCEKVTILMHKRTGR